MCEDKGEKGMAMPQEQVLKKPLRKAKREKSNLFASTNTARLTVINEKSKKNGGLSNLTYGRVYGED